jgi:hypothetical protein
MPLLVPFNPKASADQFMRVDVGGVVLRLRLMWNGRDQAWYMDVVGPAAGIHSLKLVPDSPLIGQKASFGVSGDFVLTKLDINAPARPGYFDVGNTWGLFWFSGVELGL